MNDLKKKYRVLHIITNLPIGGAQDNTLLTVEKLNRNKYDVTLMCAPNGEWVSRARDLRDTKIIFIERLVRPIRPLNDLISLFQIYRIIKREKFDIVHTHSSKPGVIGRIAARLAATPVLVHTIHGFPFHDFMHPAIRKIFVLIERLLSQITDKIITVSKLNLEKAVQLKFASRAKFENIYSGIDFGKFKVRVNKLQKKAEIGILNGHQIVGMVGRLSEQKAPLDFVSAIPKILRVSPNVQFLLIGDGELKKQTISFARKLAVEKNLKILGFREDIPELLALLDVFVLTSHWEGLGRSLTEAMYAGLPVVATRVEGVPELVKNEETGILVEPQDIDGIAEGVLKLLSDKATAARLGKSAAQNISAHFKIEEMIIRIEQLYETLLEKRDSDV